MIHLSQFNTIAHKHQAILASFSAKLEPVRQTQAKIRRVMQPVHDLADRISDVRDNVLSTYPVMVGGIQQKPSNEILNRSDAPSSNERKVHCRQLEIKISELETERDSWKSRALTIQNKHTRVRQLGGKKRHHLTNDIKDNIIKPLFTNGFVKGTSPRQIARKIHELLDHSRVDTSKKIIKPELMKLSRNLSLDEDLLLESIEYASRPSDNWERIYKWCLTFSKDKTIH